MVRGGNSRVWREGVTRAERQAERDRENSLLATTDSSTRQQYRTAFCTLKQTRRSYKLAICLDSGFPFDASSKAQGGGGVEVAWLGVGTVVLVGRE